MSTLFVKVTSDSWQGRIRFVIVTELNTVGIIAGFPVRVPVLLLVIQGIIAQQHTAGCRRSGSIMAGRGPQEQSVLSSTNQAIYSPTYCSCCD
jgi:hypothetical protein